MEMDLKQSKEMYIGEKEKEAKLIKTCKAYGKSCFKPLGYGWPKHNDENNTGMRANVRNSAEILNGQCEFGDDYMADDADVSLIVQEFSETFYAVINNNIPYYTVEEKECINTFKISSSVDKLGRYAGAYANICIEILPIEGEENLITGTRYMNFSGVVPFENMVRDYVKETGNHVLYRLTPIYSGSNLDAKGLLLEAYSVEDKGEGICFNVFLINGEERKV